MNYENMSKEELIALHKKNMAVDVYMSRNNPRVICVKPKGRSFPISADKDTWVEIVKDETINKIKELI